MTEVTTLQINPSNLNDFRNSVLSEIGVFGFDLGDDPASEVTLKSCIFPASQLVLYAYVSTGHRFSIAHHPFFTVETLIEGQLQRTLDGDAIAFEADRLAIGYPGPMSIQLIEDPESRLSRGMSCFISPEAAERLLAARGLQLSKVDCQVVTDETCAVSGSVKALLDYAYREFFDRGTKHVSPGRARIFEALLSDHIAELFLATGYASHSERGVSHSLRLVRACEAIFKERFAEPISITDVANELRADPRTLQRAFRRYRGISPSVFLSTLRLEAARSRLLASRPGDTVSSIAYDCGFVHLGRFAARYRDVYGENPQETINRLRH